MNPGRINERNDLSKMPPQLEGLDGKDVFTKEDVEKMFNALSGYADNYTNYRINEIKRFVGLPYKLEENEFDAEHNMEPHYVGPQDFEKYADKNVEKVPELNENKGVKKIKLTESQCLTLQNELMLENITVQLGKLTEAVNYDKFYYEIETAFPAFSKLRDFFKQTIEQSGCSNITFENLNGALGMAKEDGVIFNARILDSTSPQSLFFFVFFHELAHQYQIKKYGIELMFSVYLGEIPIDKAVADLVRYENTADNFAYRKVEQLKRLFPEFQNIHVKQYIRNLQPDQMQSWLTQIIQMLKSKNAKSPQEIGETLYNMIKIKNDMKTIKLNESQYSKLQDQLMLENLTTKLEELTTNNEPVIESTEVTQYNVVVKHDKGKTTIKTSGSSEQAAKEKVMKAENCPESAIVSITPIKDEKKIDEAQRTLGFGYHGGLKSKGVGKAGNKRDINEEIADIKKWNHILLKENYASEYDIQMPTAEPETDETDSMDLDDFLSQANDKKMGHNPMKTKFGGKVQLNLNTGKWEARPEEWEDINEYDDEPQSNQDYVDPMSAAKSNSRQYYDRPHYNYDTATALEAYNEAAAICEEYINYKGDKRGYYYKRLEHMVIDIYMNRMNAFAKKLGLPNFSETFYGH